MYVYVYGYVNVCVFNNHLFCAFSLILCFPNTYMWLIFLVEGDVMHTEDSASVTPLPLSTLSTALRLPSRPRSSVPQSRRPQKTDPSANEYAQIREMAPSRGVNTDGDADDDHHFVDNEFYARRVESHPPAGSIATPSTRKQDKLEKDADHPPTLADNVLYG